MIKVAVIEDNKTEAEHLRKHLAQFSEEKGEEFTITVFENAIRFLNAYRPVYDMVFMDIELPGMNGMEAAHRLRQLDQEIILIFVTNMAKFAVKGYEVDALYYLVKPVAYREFSQKLVRAVSQLKADSEAILVTQKSETKRILLREIEYIEVQGHTLLFHTETGTVSGAGVLGDMENRLKGKGFLRCNKCYLVNQKHIAFVKGYTLVMSGGDELQISRLRKNSFMSELAENMGNGCM